MFALVGAVFGFLGSGLPSILDYFRAVKDNEHELNLIDKQIEFRKMNIGAELKEADMANQMAQMQMAYQASMVSSGSKWIDALNGLIRPTITITFLSVYIFVKLPLIYMQFNNFETGHMVHGLWTDHDNTILGMIIGFFFGKSFQ